MKQLRTFDINNFETLNITIGDECISCRAYIGISYCTSPKDSIQTLNIFVPEAYYHEETINGYTMNSAPILMPNSVGGYMPGPAGMPEKGMDDKPNFIFSALKHGYIVASPGVRGRSTGRQCQDFFVGGTVNQPKSEDGELTGKAPAFLVDMKAAIRYLRRNRDVIPGDTEKIFTNGTSAGGALSALTGATGNHPDYESFLKEIGAADERDDIFGSICFCPIMNLENADAAYEWQFKGQRDAHFLKFSFDDKGQIRIEPNLIPLSDEQMKWSDELSDSFISYLNGLSLTDPEGNPLTLEKDGSGTFRDYIVSLLIQSASKELYVENTTAKRLGWDTADLTDVDKLPYLTISGDAVTALDWNAYIENITRMKVTPAFDQPDLRSPENDEFGTKEEPAKHFTEFAYRHTTANGSLADPTIIKMMNPVNYTDDPQSKKAPHWWIRHGSYDRDTSLAIPTIFALKLEAAGADVNFFIPWGIPHSGDYDLPDLFSWIDSLCPS